MKTLHNISIISSLLLICGITAHAQVQLSMDDCIRMAFENNAALRNARLDVEAARLQKQEALALYFPTASINAMGFHAMNPLLDIGITDILGRNDFAYNLQASLEDYSGIYGFNTRYNALQNAYGATVLVTQPVFAGGRIVNGNALAKLGIKAADLKLSLQNKKTAIEAEELWWSVVSLEDKLKMVQELEQTISQLGSMLESAVNAGLAADTDLMKLQLRKSELDAARRQITSGIKLAKINLFNAIGQPYSYNKAASQDERPYIDEIILIGTNELPSSPDKYWRDEAEILGKMDETALLEAQVEAKKLEKKMAIGEAMPEIGFGASYGYGKLLDRGRQNAMAFATVKIPLTDWGKTARKAQRIDTQVQKARNDQEYLGRQLMLKIGKSWLDLTSAYDQWQISIDNAATAKTIFERMQRQYEAGVVSMNSLLEAQASLSEACSKETDSLIAYREAVRNYMEL